jgi:Flp pilus assembly protein TadD
MFRLKPLEWLLALAFLLFYGFAVFALTRDYFLRHPLQPVAVRTVPQAQARLPAGPSALEAVSQLPESILESDPGLLRRQAEGLFGERRYLESIAVYRRILELAPDDAESANDLGLALFYTGDSQGSLAVLRRGAAVKPGLQRIWLTLGFVTLQSGDAAGAREPLARAMELGADNSVGQEAARLLALAGESGSGAPARP